MPRRSKKIANKWLNRRTAQIVILFLFAGAALFRILKPLWYPPPEPSPVDETTRAGDGGTMVPLVRVIDGDTIKVRLGGKLESVRLLRINTPEKGQPGFGKATEELRALLGREVRIEFEQPGRPDRDKYGRLLAYVFNGRTNANVEIVRAGWSHFFTRYGTGRFAQQFRRAETEARKKGLGLWTH